MPNTERGVLPPAKHDTIQHFDRDAVAPKAGSKTASVMLSYARIGNDYEVKQIVNSAAYKPGDWLSVEVVTQLCALPNWTVTMVEPDYFSLLSKLIP